MMDRNLDTSIGVKIDVHAMPQSGECHATNASPASAGDDDKDFGCSKISELGVDIGSTSGGRRRNSTVHSLKSSHRGKTPQDMTTPLKKWLYENRRNPYPTKNEKVTLAHDSEMTLIQVTNWFANARRRLKNTVRKPGLTWSKRIKLYDRQASDTVDGLPEELDGTSKDNTENHGLPSLQLNSPVVIPGFGNSPNWPTAPSTMTNGEEARLRAPPPQSPMYFTEPANSHKFKQTILHRYLNDSVAHQSNGYQPQAHRFTDERAPPLVRYCESGSTGSCDNEDSFSCSPNSIRSDGNQTAFQDGCAPYVDYTQSYGIQGQDRWCSQKTMDAEEIYWKEIIAAVVLTNMARAKLQQRPL